MSVPPEISNNMGDLEKSAEAAEIALEVGEETVNIKTANDELFKLRSYQDEMLEESLTRNTIVVLNTGAGKTHIAIARIRAELESSDSDKLVWLLAPTVALCNQHYKTLETNLPAYQLRILTSEDNVDRWTNQIVWDGVLKNMKIIISTYGVLYDALCHGFVTMQRLALCVFDEAHHCTKKHPSNMIMQHFYRPAKLAGHMVPKILGLSASPVMNARAGGLETLEANLDSHAITPRLYRSELKQFVHVPELTKRVYANLDVSDMLTEGSILEALRDAIGSYNIRSDPYVVELSKAEGLADRTRLEKVRMSKKTYCTEQLLALRTRAEVIARNVSLAASDMYIQTCCHKFLTGIRQSNTPWMPELSEKEKAHLARILSSLGEKSRGSQFSALSPKMQLLLKLLRQEAGDSFTGIIFVEQRAVVAALAEYLTSLPEFANLFNIGTFVGGSNSSQKKANIGDINDLKSQQQTLDAFRKGKKNLIISTSVLEEGIDVSSCQTVICFDAPSNLVSFVQRRGRARKKHSKYIILLADDDKKGEPTKWHDLEDKMKAAYEDELRNAQLAAEIENIDENDGRMYQVRSTGALLTLDNAKSHLHHFCSTLQTSNYVDLRPTFVCPKDLAGLVTAEVTLPTCVNQKYRRAVSAHSWRTEKAAVKDAAFVACVALHSGGLLNDHLLPLSMITPDQAKQERPSLVQVAKRLDPWSLDASNVWYEHTVEVDIRGKAKATMLMLLPVQCPKMSDITLHWTNDVEGSARIKFDRQRVLDEDALVEGRRKTWVLLKSVFPRLSDRQELANCAVIFEPPSNGSIDHFSGHSSSLDKALPTLTKASDIGLLRTHRQPGRAFVLESETMSDERPHFDGRAPHLLQLDVIIFPKKRDFLDIPAKVSRRKEDKLFEFLMSDCMVDALPARYSFFAACVPSILHRVENAIIAHDLQQNLLRPIGLEDLQLVIEAATSSSANSLSNYERVEFLGDAVLKYLTHVQLTAEHDEWHESYLTAEKGRTNGNASLYQAALRSGVDRYISTERFTANHWHPPDISAVKKEGDETVERSTKTLADVVEALIGASYVDKGLEGAIACIKIFLPDEEWYGLAECHRRLLQPVPESEVKVYSIDLLQELIGYRFDRPLLLLEATTHVSYSSDSLSYERLEFLGDSVLDQIIIPEMFVHPSNLKNHEMHDLRQSLANSHILGFCCMEMCIDQERFDPTNDTDCNTTTLVKTSKRFHLYDFLRCIEQFHRANQPALLRHQQLRTQVLQALEQGNEYPWPDLLALRPPKCFSDLIESILGAIYIDSSGSLDRCRDFVSRCGILKLLRRFLNEDVRLGFPKVRLGMVADKQRVVYDSKETEVDLEKEGPRTWSCAVSVGEKQIVEVSGCCSKEEAEVRGAVEAIHVLQRRNENRKRQLEVEVDDDEDEEMIDAE